MKGSTSQLLAKAKKKRGVGAGSVVAARDAALAQSALFSQSAPQVALFSQSVAQSVPQSVPLSQSAPQLVPQVAPLSQSAPSPAQGFRDPPLITPTRNPTIYRELMKKHDRMSTRHL